MPECCGSERTTPFCPMCGKALSAHHERALLCHVQKQARMRRERYTFFASKDDYPDQQEILANEQPLVAKWEAWERFVRRAIEAGITCEEKPSNGGTSDG